MNKALSEQFTPIAADSSHVRNGVIVIAGSALVAVCAHLALPLYFTPVPLTLQTFAVLVLGLVLSPRMAAVTLCAYLLEGAVGLPVFAPSVLGAGGLTHLFGPTGGYLLAYPLAAASASFLWRATTQRGFLAAALSAGAGSLAILAIGALWIAIFSHAPVSNILTVAVIPFLPGDALKIVAAAGLACGFARVRRQTA